MRSRIKIQRNGCRNQITILETNITGTQAFNNFHGNYCSLIPHGAHFIRVSISLKRTSHSKGGVATTFWVGHCFKGVILDVIHVLYILGVRSMFLY